MEKMDTNSSVDFVGKVKEFFSSIKNRLEPAYRKQYIIRKIFSCFLLYASLFIMMDSGWNLDVSLSNTIALIWTIVAWMFWHYSFWSYQGGIVDNFSRSLIHFGSIWAIIGRLIFQNCFILIWIAFIAPISGIKTWLKAVKNDKRLFVNNSREDVWN